MGPATTTVLGYVLVPGDGKVVGAIYLAPVKILRKSLLRKVGVRER